MNWIRFFGILGVVSTSTWAEGSLQRTLKAFEDKPGYVQPLATWFGTFTNTGWVRSARVNSGFGWGFAIPVSVGYINEDDHTYTNHFATGCAELSDKGIACPTGDTRDYEVPTILGPKTNVEYTSYKQNPLDSTSYVTFSGGFADDGDETLRDITTLGLVWPQLSLSYQHTQLTVRAMGLPSIGEFAGYSHLGFALQYSLGHLWAHRLPSNHPVDVSLLTSYNFISLGYSPSDYTGELSLDFTTMWHALVIGTRLGDRFEIFSELGYETSNLKSSGELIAKDEGEDDISPRVEIDGRNGFKASLNLAFHFDTYHPLGSMSYGAQAGNTLNILNFGKEGTP